MGTGVRSGVTLGKVLSIDLPNDSSSAWLGRDWLGGVFVRFPDLLSKYRREDAILCLSELITNALRHAGTACVVRVTWTGDSLEIAVEDGVTDRWLAPPPPEEGRELWEAGRGHVLIEALADGWGVRASKRLRTKAVWVTFEGEREHREQKQCVPKPR